VTACETRPLSPAAGSVGARARRGQWERAYRRGLLLIDGSAGLIAGIAGYLVLVQSGRGTGDWRVAEYSLLTVALPVGWLAAVALVGGYEPRPVGGSVDDWRTLVASGGLVLAVVAALAWGTRSRMPPEDVLLPLAFAATLSLTGRASARRRLRVRRERGQCVQRVLAVGPAPAVRAFAARLAGERLPAAVVVACCLPDAGRAGGPDPVEDTLPVPVLGGIGDVAAAVHRTGADTVAVLPCPELEGPALRRLAWAVEGRARYLVVLPGPTDVAHPRLRVRPVCGLPALDVRHSQRSGAAQVVKRLADRALALTALVVLAPVVVGIAIAVRLTDPGPVLFRQIRVGRHGREFVFLKFRTMHVGAEHRGHEFAANNINADGPLFKLRVDPRVTRVGAFLRRWSLDELPQLLNVLMGHMSLVGPRPPLPHEVARYSDDVRRRLLVRPGLTGLWQVSGRSDLPWDDAVRLDLRYVDNWSLALDVSILMRTLPAVLHRAGAY
jgi:exopolysaccharide biosynthesis polyprenyl glycosylphosphotransferase